MFNKLITKYKETSRGTKTMLWLWIATFVTLILFVIIVGIYTSEANAKTGDGVWSFGQTAKAKANVQDGVAVPAAPKNVHNLAEWKKTQKGEELSVFWIGLKLIAKPVSGSSMPSNLIAGFGLLFVLTLFVAIFITAFIVYKRKQEGGNND